MTEKNLLRKLYQHQPHFASTLSLFNKDNLHLQANPFLAALGRQGRDYISLLDHYDDLSQYHSYISEVINDHIDLFESLDPNSLLRQLQDDILEQRSLSDTRNHWAAIDVTTDTSIRMHSTHSKQRELEVLHDQLLARFDADPALCPTDIVVMMPDINAYAPYINAVFGLADHADVCRIPYVISGRKQRGHDPLYITLERLLNLPVSRWTVSEIMDLLDVASVRRCFGIAVTDLPLLHRWIKGSGIRWGLDGKQREQLGLPSANQANSWLFGLSRMLLGFAVGRGVAWDGIEPYDEIGGLDAAVIGQIWALVQRLADTADTMRQPATPDEWVKRLSKLVDDFFTMQDVHELEQRLNWLRQLDAWRDACLLGGLDQPLPLAVVREAWLSDIDTGSLNKHFLSGAVNFCTFISMRAVPFKVVCLLGMNDKDFPRRVNQNDFDLMQHDYRPGDRSLRDDDRYLFLEALLSAREQLYISWVGRNPCDNSKHLPSILVRQFLSHLDCGWQLKDNALSVSAALTCEHPLQSFSAQYFPLATKQGLNGWFTYSPAWYLRHESIILQTVGRDTPLAAVNFDQVISLTDVGNFLKQPVDVFFRDRLGIYFPSQQSVNADHESFALSKFETYGIYHSLYERLLPKIEAGLCGEDLRVAIWSDIARLQSAGRLPSAAFGELSAQALVQPAQYALDNYAALVDTWGESLPMPILFQHMDCDNNVTINDSFTGIRHAQGRRVCLRLDAGKLHHGTRFRWDRLVHYWVRHLALQQLGMPADSIIVSQTGVVILAAMPAYQAGDILQRIIALRADGLTKPLPVACRSAFGWLDALHDQSLRTGSKIPPHITKSNALAAAQITYEGKYNIDGEIVRSMALRRAYPHFYLMLQGGFEHYAQALYGSLHDWVNRSSAVEHRLAILNADISHE